MSKMDWGKARKFKYSEEKYEPGMVFDNGRVIHNGPRDTLDARARRAEKIWETEQAKKKGKRK